MAFRPIPLSNGKTIRSLADAKEIIGQIGTRERGDRHWVNAIAEFNNAIVDRSREARARDGLCKALQASLRA
jgi:hypothetical protein